MIYLKKENTVYYSVIAVVVSFKLNAFKSIVEVLVYVWTFVNVKRLYPFLKLIMISLKQKVRIKCFHVNDIQHIPDTHTVGRLNNCSTMTWQWLPWWKKAINIYRNIFFLSNVDSWKVITIDFDGQRSKSTFQLIFKTYSTNEQVAKNLLGTWHSTHSG